MAGDPEDWADAPEVIEAGAFDGQLPAVVPVRSGWDGPVVGEAHITKAGTGITVEFTGPLPREFSIDLAALTVDDGPDGD